MRLGTSEYSALVKCPYMKGDWRPSVATRTSLRTCLNISLTSTGWLMLFNKAAVKGLLLPGGPSSATLPCRVAYATRIRLVEKEQIVPAAEEAQAWRRMDCAASIQQNEFHTLYAIDGSVDMLEGDGLRIGITRLVEFGTDGDKVVLPIDLNPMARVVHDCKIRHVPARDGPVIAASMAVRSASSKTSTFTAILRRAAAISRASFAGLGSTPMC